MTEGGREAGKRRKGNELDKESQRQAEMFKGALKRGKRKKIAKKERNYGWIGGWTDGWIDGWTDQWIDGWMGWWMDRWMMDGWANQWIDGWMGE